MNDDYNETSDPSRKPPDPHKSGYVAIIGNPNAGKSTLMNSLLGSRLSITTHKPQTTRHQVIGIHSDEISQIIFLDTPGILEPSYELQRAMMRYVERARSDADLILLLADATDRSIPSEVLQLLTASEKSVWLLVNKLDLVPKEDAETLAAAICEQTTIEQTFLLSALTGEGVDRLIPAIREKLPAGPPYYPPDMVSEHPVRFFVAELIREQIFLQFQMEIPYSATVEVISYEERTEMDHIHAEIIVNRKSQKGILIGKGGRAIRELGTEARKTIEAFIDKPVFLDLHVKVREKWREREDWVRNFGYR